MYFFSTYAKIMDNAKYAKSLQCKISENLHPVWVQY